jgi:hypothetical protein
MKAKMVTSKKLALLVAISLTFLTWGVAPLADYHNGYDCGDCHDMHGGSSNLSLIAECVPWAPPDSPPCTPPALPVVFLDNDGPFPDWDYADGDTTYDGICEVCHTTTKYYRNDGSCPDPPCDAEDEHPDYESLGGEPTGQNGPPGSDCMICHSHCEQFSHCSDPQAGCHATQSHLTHTDGTAKGPDPLVCVDCHDPAISSEDPPNNDPYKAEDMALFGKCDACHSPDGAFDGVNDPDIGAKNCWNIVYEEDDVTLKAGKEKWCAGCHDNEPAYSLPVGTEEPTIVDNADDPPATGSSGTWSASSWAGGFYGTNYQYHTPGAGDYFRWTPTITTPGTYTVSVRYPQWQSPWNWATNATYTIHYDGGSSSTPVPVNQRANGGTWFSLGDFNFTGAGGEYVELSSHASSYVIADAVKWGSGASGTFAPNVIGDDIDDDDIIDYGFYLTGHDINCLSCHDASSKHIDGDHRTYVKGLDNYQAGYRLRSVDGAEQPMKIPRPRTTKHPLVRWKDFALCFDCHDKDELLVWDPSDHTNFWHDPTQVNYHIKHLKMGRGDFDSDWNGVGDSDYTCTACHNVHGSPTAAMIRHGELIDQVPGLNFSYLVLGGEFATATWDFSGAADSYYVYARWTSDPAHPEWRASNAKYTLNHAGGPSHYPKNQQTGGGTWSQFDTGTFSFGPGNSVVLSNEGADGPIVADAIGWDRDGNFADDWDSDGVLDPEIVVDNPAASFTPSASAWSASSWTPGYHGTNYQYHGAPEAVIDPSATVDKSVGGIMDYAGPGLSQNGVCGACHVAVPYYRIVNLGPKVIFPRAEPASVENNDTTQVLLMAHVLDKDNNLIPIDPVVINLLTIGGIEEQPMYDDGTNGDQQPNDGIFTYQTTVPGTVDVGDKTLTVTATDQGGGTSQGDVILTVTNPNVVTVDNFGQTYTEDHGPWSTSTYAASYYPPDYQWHAGGAGDDYFQWTPTITIPGTYEVSVWYPVWQSPWSWATDATFTVYHDGGSTPVPVNQQAGGGTWVSLGTYDCDGTDDYVRLSQHSWATVIADAVNWELQP